MANYIYIKVEATNATIANLNTSITGDPSTGINLLTDLLDSVNCRSTPSTVYVYVSTADQTITAGGGGSSATYVKT